jgi:membrane protein DedA with SNARE-associated domain
MLIARSRIRSIRCCRTFWRFLAYSAVGTVVWTAALASAGWILQANYDAASKYLGKAGQAVFLPVFLLFAAWIVWRYVRQWSRSRAEN